ncbi:hypothetical protein C900_00076 [Fulvivirga imtechensis AK7]|uniref:Uncharacterized protein n=1 Tax=Fulvivirga imtechensis AK7 TaxID=1237149 RepID=L8K367_9BACT|nr:hypothetical protein C900_00076 [Fulvivirga imtechensis AK7]
MWKGKAVTVYTDTAFKVNSVSKKMPMSALRPFSAKAAARR